MLSALEGDLAQSSVGAVARLRERRAEGDDVQDAPPGSGEAVLAFRRCGMREVDSFDGGRGIQSRQRTTGEGRLRVALARQHDRHGNRIGEHRTREILEMTGCRGQQQVGQRVDQPGQHDLRLGVSEARVELDDFHALLRQDQPGVEQADERGALFVELADDGLGDLAGDEVDELVLAAEGRLSHGRGE